MFYVCTGEQTAQSLSIQSIINSALAGAQQGPAAQANADLLLSCLQGKPSPAQELANTLHTLLGLPTPPASSTQAPNGGRIATRGAALAVVLVQRLLQTVVQHPTQVLDWRNRDLDSLACCLAKAGGAKQPTDSTDSIQASSQTESQRLETDNASADAAATDEASAGTASLATQVAAAALDASEQTAAARGTVVTHIISGVTSMGLQPGAANHAVQDFSSCAQLLGALVRGEGNVSLLTDQAMHEVLSHFQACLQAAGSHTDAVKLATLTLPACDELGACRARLSFHGVCRVH